MMFSLRPAWKVPTVTTARPVGAASRETMHCRRVTAEEAMRIGSMERSGMEPWAPLPWNVTLKESARDMASPLT